MSERRIRKILPVALMAGAFLVPGANALAKDKAKFDSLVMRSRDASTTTVMSHQARPEGKPILVGDPNWGRVWAKVVWARVG